MYKCRFDINFFRKSATIVATWSSYEGTCAILCKISCPNNIIRNKTIIIAPSKFLSTLLEIPRWSSKYKHQSSQTPLKDGGFTFFQNSVYNYYFLISIDSFSFRILSNANNNVKLSSLISLTFILEPQETEENKSIWYGAWWQLFAFF